MYVRLCGNRDALPKLKKYDRLDGGCYLYTTKDGHNAEFVPYLDDATGQKLKKEGLERKKLAVILTR
jgi:hypothetical protein